MPRPKRQSTGRSPSDPDLYRILQDEDLVEKLAFSLAEKVNKVLEKRVDILEKTTKEMKNENKKLKQKVVELEQYGRRNSIRIYGIPEESKENTVDVVIRNLNSKLGFTLTRKDIDACHRLKQHGNKNKPRSIICKFTSRLVRDDVFYSKKKLKGSKISIKEDLTRERMQLYKKITEKINYKSVWTARGVIYVMFNNKKFRFTNEDEFEEFCSQNQLSSASASHGYGSDETFS
ncbi:hypothetical protein M8J76_006692 [Diaphorina citri]|jgi:hypothetical protein|nr:hypothetical protein M8J77_008805 [Diaphorina citri]KAI5715897.1 hypothetical protein M8J77_024292 [Diaphorina citri]KAI5719041.1 hypothetical protein M8J76_004163 [Diaphorina citri]KAI5720734.1 hypothetical protein M8J77_011092 [Diaphorina citri]KAI5738238.1 hypothetical protein M8J77_004423 [Diaphorina citri]